MAYNDINTYVTQNAKSDTVSDGEAIVNTIANIVLIPRRTQKFRASSGSFTSYFLNKQVHPSVATQLRNALLQDLNRQQPFANITVNDIGIVVTQQGTGYDLHIRYTSKLNGAAGKVSMTLSQGDN